jgi:predicted nuclease with TOPRIM domain
MGWEAAVDALTGQVVNLASENMKLQEQVEKIESLQERIRLLEGQKYLLLSAYEAYKKENQHLKDKIKELEFQLEHSKEKSE